MMNVKKYIRSGILEQYVLGLVSEEEQAEIEGYMVTYPKIRQKVSRLRSCMEHYSGIHDISSPDHGKSNTLEQKKAKLNRCLSVEYKFGQAKQKMQAVRNYTRVLAGLACFFIAFFAGLSIYFYKNGEARQVKLTEVNQRLQEVKAQYSVVVSRSQSLMTDHKLLKDPHTKKLLMQGAKLTPEAMAVLYYNDLHKKTLLDLIHMPDPPVGHQYQLWANVNERMVNIGTISRDAPMTELHPMQFINQVNDFSMTIEPVEGSDSPTLAKRCLWGTMK